MARKRKHIANLEQVELTDIGNKGKAVGRHGEKVVFVSGGVPGDVVEVKVTKKRRNYLEGKVVKVDVYSPDREKHNANTLEYVAVANGRI